MADSDLPVTDECPVEPRERDGGFTFVETVLTIVLIGIVVVPVLAAVRGAVHISSTSKAAAEIQTVLINAADRVQRADGTATCDFSTFAENAAVAAGWPAEDVDVDQQYLDVATGTWVAGPAYGAACPDGDPQQRTASRITITATSPTGDLQRSIQVVKTDV